MRVDSFDQRAVFKASPSGNIHIATRKKKKMKKNQLGKLLGQ
jgi:hypothetical protein